MSNTETVTFTDNNSGPDAPQVAEEQPRVEGLPENSTALKTLLSLTTNLSKNLANLLKKKIPKKNKNNNQPKRL